MSKIINPNISIDELKQNYLANNVLKLSNDYTQNNSNYNNFMPTFDFNTDIKLLMNSDTSYFNQSDSNPFGLSKLSINKYNQIKSYNLENKQKNVNDNNINNDNKEEEINELNSSDENNDEIKNNINNEKRKYRKIDNTKKFSSNNKNKENKENKENDMEKKGREVGKENINNNLQVSSILNDTIGDNIINKNKNCSNINEKGDDLIEFLKKENDELKKSNEKNIQIINSLFFFINQLSQKYSPDKKLFDLSHYNSNISSLSSDLNNLNEYIENQKPKNEVSVKANKISSIKTEIKEKNKNDLVKKKSKENKINKRKNDKEVNLGKTFTFGQNDSFNKKNKKNKENKINKNRIKDKDIFPIIKEDNHIKKIDNKNNNRISNSRNKSKNKNDINLLGCNVKGNNNSIKNNSKISSDNKNFNCIPNEKEAMNSIKNIIYKK